MTTLLSAIGYASLAFSIIGFIEVVFGFLKQGTYNLMRAIIYCTLFGIGVVLCLK